MAALAAAVLYFIARRRYRCPYCTKIVRWNDVDCSHCGNDMKLRHRAGPESIPRAARNLKRQTRRKA